MNSKGKKVKNQVKNEKTLNVLSPEELKRRIEQVEASMKASTWRNLEVGRRFKKNEKLTFISDEMLIVGCDVGSETHYVRAIDTRGRELSKAAFPFSNDSVGFQSAKTWALQIAAANKKNQIVLGLEPTGHYWFCLAAWMIAHGITVVQVNPYAVKQTKELEDNSQNKDDRKDPKLIANLVKDGNYGMPYLPEGIYAELRRLSMLRDQLTEDRIRNENRLHREMKIYFPEYQDAFGKLDGPFTLEVLKQVPFPQDIIRVGSAGLNEIWHKAKLRGRGYSRAEKIIDIAKKSIGLKEGTEGSRIAVQWFADQITVLTDKLKEVEEQLEKKVREIPYADKVLEIKGIGEKILSGMIAEIGDISRFDNVKEIQKLSGLGLVACSSGKHKGETKISYRGRKRLRYWLFLASKSAVAHSEEFMQLHIYYTTRKENPLKKMQSLIAIACKILRIVITLIKQGNGYDPERMMKDIKRPTSMIEQVA